MGKINTSVNGPIDIQRGRDSYFPKGNENGDFYEPLWLASIDGDRKFHGQTAIIAARRCWLAKLLENGADEYVSDNDKLLRL